MLIAWILISVKAGIGSVSSRCSFCLVLVTMGIRQPEEVPSSCSITASCITIISIIWPWEPCCDLEDNTEKPQLGSIGVEWALNQIMTLGYHDGSQGIGWTAFEQYVYLVQHLTLSLGDLGSVVVLDLTQWGVIVASSLADPGMLVFSNSGAGVFPMRDWLNVFLSYWKVLCSLLVTFSCWCT